MDDSRYQLVYMQIRYNQKSKKLEVLKIDSYNMDTFAQTAAVAYAKHELAWKIQFRKSIIFTSNPAWNHSNVYSFAVVIKKEVPRLRKMFYSYGFSFDLSERRGQFKRNIVELIDFLCSNNRSFVDISLNASKWHKILSIPDDYRILTPDEIIEESDLEYHESSRSEGYFSKPNWYNIGKQISSGHNMSYVKNGITYAQYKSLPRPFVARKITQSENHNPLF